MKGHETLPESIINLHKLSLSMRYSASSLAAESVNLFRLFLSVHRLVRGLRMALLPFSILSLPRGVVTTGACG